MSFLKEKRPTPNRPFSRKGGAEKRSGRIKKVMKEKTRAWGNPIGFLKERKA
jgi:hypothetical protein